MNLLGLDPATGTGFAICGDDGRIHTTGKWSPKAKWTKECSETKAAINARVANEARRWIMSMIKMHKIQVVGMEDLNVTVTKPEDGQTMHESTSRNKQTAIQIGLRMGCDELSVPFHAFADATWRKSFLGHGKKLGRKTLKAEAKKMCEQMHIDARNEDSRDAAGVLFHLQCFLRHPRHQPGSFGPLFKPSEEAA